MQIRWLTVWLLAALVALPATAKESKTSEAQARWRSGKEALAAGRLPHARHFLLQALALEPANMEIVGDLLRVEAKDPEARAIWLHYAASAGADGSGRFKVPRTWPKVSREALAEAQTALKLRAEALKTLARAASKCKSSKYASVLRYVSGAARHVGSAAPAPLATVEAAVNKAKPRTAPQVDKVVGALHKLMRKLLADEKHADALEAARILHGLHQQAGQDPGAGAKAGKDLPAILSAKRAARKALRNGVKVHTLEDLQAVPETERDAWSRKHATWAHPGLSESPNALYQVETVCGLETLLVVTEDIEYHHKRLVDWYGTDPFAKRQGLVRLVKSQPDFESSGQPFWWAGGFQSGDVTTVRVNFTSRHGLMGVLTHELTHRFDGTIYPGLSSWLLEGRAVHTANCSVDPHAAKLDERSVSFGAFWKANAEGYWRQKKLEDLIKGTIAEYRDNYSAGYALWVFLNRFQSFDPAQQDDPIFAPKVEAYLKSFRKNPRADPLERFGAFFLDGKAGRPSDMKTFSELFARALRDGAATDPPPWRQAWMRMHRQARKGIKRAPRVRIEDRATWPRYRNRADPVEHGEQHAFAAALLLAKHGVNAPAYLAFEWALQVDEPAAEHSARAAEHSRKHGPGEAAWVQQNEAHRLHPQRFPAPDGAAPGIVGEAWRKMSALREGLAKQEAAARELKQPRLARALRAEQNGLGSWLGFATLDRIGATPPDPSEEPLPPDCDPYVGELSQGVSEVRWSPLESEKRGDWHVPNAGALELGRKKAGEALTGRIRDAGVRRVFVRANRWHQGTYTFRTQVRFLSAHVSARLVIGWTRRDRGIEITLGGGDLAYATGRRDEATELRGIRIGVNDLRPFDRSTSPLRTPFRFRSPRETFTVSAHVDGAYVRVKVNGRVAVVHRRSTGDPIQGYVGFGLRSGLVRFEDPETRVHRVLGPDHACGCETHDQPIRLDEPLTFPWSTCVGRRVEGLPRHARGTFVIWYPEATVDKERNPEYVEDAIKGLREPFERAKLPVRFLLALPPPREDGVDFARGINYGLPAGAVKEHTGSPGLVEFLERAIEADAQRMHRGNQGTGLKEAREIARTRLLGGPTWFMLDEFGVVRACGTHGPLVHAVNLAHHLAGW